MVAPSPINEEEMTDDFAVIIPEEEGILEHGELRFHTANAPNGLGFVSLNSICDMFGLNPDAQRRRIGRQDSYYRPFTALMELTTEGGKQTVFCLRADAVPIFLTGVSLERLKDTEGKERLRAFLQEAHTVLAEHFDLSERGELDFHRDALARAVALHEGMEGRLDEAIDEALNRMREEHAAKVQEIREAFSGLRKTVRNMEKYVGPGERLTPEQLGQLKATVDRLAALMQEKRGVARPYQGIYVDIFNRAGVSRSEHIRQEFLPDILLYLDDQINVLLKSDAEEGTAKED